MPFTLPSCHYVQHPLQKRRFQLAISKQPLVFRWSNITFFQKKKKTRKNTTLTNQFSEEKTLPIALSMYEQLVFAYVTETPCSLLSYRYSDTYWWSSDRLQYYYLPLTILASEFHRCWPSNAIPLNFLHYMAHFSMQTIKKNRKFDWLNQS